MKEIASWWVESNSIKDMFSIGINGNDIEWKAALWEIVYEWRDKTDRLMGGNVPVPGRNLSMSTDFAFFDHFKSDYMDALSQEC